ncbi:MAG: histidine ammonia-lyase [Anaerolineaceae bacterium]|jgi:histidine ammonia-lyase|nr:MAG: histidine ammonia-lyase [Anaerolineaceae bacterium]
MIQITGNDLSIEQVIRVAFGKENVEIHDSAKKQVNESNQRLKENLKKDFPYYGINTGYGIFHSQKISTRQLAALNRNLILSHAIGAGPDFDEGTIRAAMLIRANSLAKGFSGIRLIVIQTLLDMLNKGVIPQIRTQGSMGSSGDLCQLAQLALVLTTDEQDLDQESGKAWYKGKFLSGKKAMQSAGITRIILEPKEGLALINGATFSAALGVISCWLGRNLCHFADISLALTMEALLGRKEAFDPRLHTARGMVGQIDSAQNVWNAIEGSTFVNSSDHVQDGYAIRCAPQVHGAVRDTLTHAEIIISHEINAATDNPLIFDNCDVISGGNFHGEPIAFIMDFLGIALAELGAIAERRIFRLLDSHLSNGLPLMLIADDEKAGLESGLMIPQYSAASLVMENQHLANSDAVHSLPTSANQEDHNANSLTASKHTLMIAENVLRILAIEMYTSAHAVDIRRRQYPFKQMGKGTSHFYAEIRKEVQFHAHDTLWGEEINKLVAWLKVKIYYSKQ